VIWRYKAYSFDGEAEIGGGGSAVAVSKRKVVRDVVEAEDYDSAVALVRGMHLLPVYVAPDDESFISAVRKFARPRVPVREQKFFFEGFAAMHEARIPLNEALAAAADRCTHKRYQTALRAVASEVASGTQVHVAMERRPREFSSLQVALVKAAEVAGSLPPVLRSMARMLDNLYQTGRQVQSATINPLIVLGIGTIALILVLTFIVPQMKGLTTGLGVTIPWPTQVVLNASDALTHPLTWLLMIAFIVLAPFGYSLAMQNDDIAFRVQSVYLKVPMIGVILRQYHMTRIARTLATMLEAKVPQKTALPLLIPLAGIVPFRRAMERIVSSTADGTALSLSFRLEKVVDPIVVQYLILGQRTGFPDVELHHAADFLDREVKQRLDDVTKYIEPILSSVVGSSLSMVFFVLYLPYYSIIDKLTRLGSGSF
jgi:type II secretory pathway component PulF